MGGQIFAGPSAYTRGEIMFSYIFSYGEKNLFFAKGVMAQSPSSKYSTACDQFGSFL